MVRLGIVGLALVALVVLLALPGRADGPYLTDPAGDANGLQGLAGGPVSTGPASRADLDLRAVHVAFTREAVELRFALEALPGARVPVLADPRVSPFVRLDAEVDGCRLGLGAYVADGRPQAFVGGASGCAAPVAVHEAFTAEVVPATAEVVVRFPYGALAAVEPRLAVGRALTAPVARAGELVDESTPQRYLALSGDLRFDEAGPGADLVIAPPPED